MGSIFKNRNFMFMWIAMLLSMTGTFLFLLVLSARLFLQSESSVLAGGVFAAQWLPAVFLLPIIAYLCSRFRPVMLLPVLELLSAVATVAIALVADWSSYWIFCLLLLRGSLEATTKSSRFIALKIYIPNDLIEKAASVFNTSMYVGAGLGGLIGTFVVDQFSLLSIALFDASTFLLAAILYRLLGSNRGAEKEAAKATSSNKNSSIWINIGIILKGDRQLLSYCIYLILITGFYQGYHVIARTVIPITLFDMGVKGVTIYQVVTCLSLVLAGLFVYHCMCGEKRRRFFPLIIFAATSLSMVMTVISTNYITGLISYFVFIFLFEVNYTKCMNMIITNKTPEELSILIPFINSSSMIAMVLCIFITGKAIDTWGLVGVTFVLSGIAFFLATTISTSIRGIGVSLKNAIGEKL
ncbi:MAG: MFS transporter [Desulforhopalus sp.]